ncbi:MAG: DUF177 domain-containing protein [Lachnospiraceae bacterium]|nr:DUF177 domain-containing protein [Lachnospiraceae bacterium]
MNLTEVFQQEGKRISLSIPLDEQIKFEKKWKDTPLITLKFSNLEKGKVLMEGKGEVQFFAACDRCLADKVETVSLDFERELFSPDISIDEDTREEQYYLNGYDLEIPLLLQEVLHMYWPTKILCKEDCKGICKKCGQDLNVAACQCDDFVPDVRFANLMDLFNNSK